MVKCYPCIKGCGMFKGLLGVILVALGIWFYSSSPQVLDCNKFQAACAPAFDQLLTDIATKEAAVAPTGLEQEFCDCWSNCLNYFQVYEKKQDDPAETNCFRKSNILLPSTNANHEQTPQSNGNRAVPGLDLNKCYSCEEVDDHQVYIFNWLGALAMSCGVSLWILAACEYMEVKWHNTCYSLCVLFTDFLVASTLTTGFFIALVGSAVCAAACDPDAMRRGLEDAGRDSTDGEANHAAAWGNFAISLLQPMATELCAERARFGVYMFGTGFGLLACFFSFFATLCLCCHCTEDGKDDTPDDRQAEEMKTLMQQDY